MYGFLIIDAQFELKAPRRLLARVIGARVAKAIPTKGICRRHHPLAISSTIDHRAAIHDLAVDHGICNRLGNATQRSCDHEQTRQPDRPHLIIPRHASAATVSGATHEFCATTYSAYREFWTSMVRCESERNRGPDAGVRRTIVETQCTLGETDAQ
jgi:hypothetical protein